MILNSMPNDDLGFGPLAEEFLAIWARFEPEWALARVLTGYPVHLAGLDYDDDGAQHSVLSSLLSALEELDETCLDPWQRAAYERLYRLAHCECRALFDPAVRLRDPLRKLPLGALLVASRAVIPGSEAAWLNLLEQLPDQLLGFRRQWGESSRFIVPALVEQAVAQLTVVIRVVSQFGHQDWGTLEAVPSFLDRLEETLRALRRCLKAEALSVVGGTPGLGAKAYRELLTQRYRLDLDFDALLVALTTEQTTRWDELCLDRDEAHRPSAWDQQQNLIVQQSEGARLNQATPAEQLRILHAVGRQVQERLTHAGLLETTLVPPRLIPVGWMDWPGPSLTTALPTLFLPGESRCFLDIQEAFRSLAHLRRVLLSEVWGGAHGLDLPVEMTAWAGFLDLEFLAGWGLMMRSLWVERGLGEDSDRWLLSADRLATCERALLDLRLHLGLTTWEALDQEHPSVTSAERLTTIRHPGRHLAAWLTGRFLESWVREQIETGDAEDFLAFRARLAPAALASFPLWLRMVQAPGTLEDWLTRTVGAS
ncbi:hypothetical protein CCP4SC76_5780009 [Gammaproteobacteria bacterium]